MVALIAMAPLLSNLDPGGIPVDWMTQSHVLDPSAAGSSVQSRPARAGGEEQVTVQSGREGRGGRLACS